MGLGIGPTNPVENLFPLTNDDYGTRQFLYPAVHSIPEPSTLLLVALGSLGLIAYRRRGRQWERRQRA